MISDVLSLLKDVVNAHLGATLGWGSTQPDHGQVVFPDSEASEANTFKLGAITLMLVNLEQEHSLRHGDPYRRVMADGVTQRVQPPIHLNAYVLFAARFKDYADSLRYVSLILQYFQTNRVLDHENTPMLNDGIEKLIMDVMTLPFAEHYNLWSLLRTTYQPSILYKVRILAYQDEEGLAAPAGATVTTRINQQ